MCIRDRVGTSRVGCPPVTRASRGRGHSAPLALSLIHISEPTRLLSISYAVFCLKKKRRPPRSTRVRSSAASDVYKRQGRDVSRRLPAGDASKPRPGALGPTRPVSYTHLRAHETPEHLVCRLLLEKKTATTEIYTRKIVGSVRCV